MHKKNHSRGFDQITSNKPCSVLDNHLSAPRCLANRFSSLLQVPLPKFGFLAYGVYHVPLLYFYKTRLFDTFTGAIHGSLFRISASRQSETAQAYRFTWHKHYIHRRMCEHGLSSEIQRLSECYLLYTISSSLDTLFNRSTEL